MINSTPENLLTYLYNELKTSDKSAIEFELQLHWTLREKFNILREAKLRLEKMTLQSPRKQTLQSIMHYATKSLEGSKI